MSRPFFPVTKVEARRLGIQYSAQANRDCRFCARLRRLRNEKGVSIAQAAADLHIAKSTVGLYETGDTIPSADTVRKLAAYYDVSCDYLLGRTSVRSSSADIQSAVKATGLSEQAVEKLARMNTSEIIGEKNSQLLLCEVSQLVLSPHFLRILTILARLRSGAGPKESVKGTIEWFDHLDNAKKELSHCPGYSLVDSETVRTALEFEVSKIFNKIVEEVQGGEQNGEEKE